MSELLVVDDPRKLTGLTGVLDVDDPGHDDFELWSPSEERTERCLFGRQVIQDALKLNFLTEDLFVRLFIIAEYGTPTVLSETSPRPKHES